jgi:hypothetical protein
MNWASGDEKTIPVFVLIKFSVLPIHPFFYNEGMKSKNAETLTMHSWLQCLCMRLRLFLCPFPYVSVPSFVSGNFPSHVSRNFNGFFLCFFLLLVQFSVPVANLLSVL